MIKKEGFELLINTLKSFSKDYTVALINPTTTDLTRKLHAGITKKDQLDTIAICDVLVGSSRKNNYRIIKVNHYAL